MDAWNGIRVAQYNDSATAETTLVAAFFEGLITNTLNPKVSIFYLAAFPQFISQTESAYFQSFALVFIHSMLNLLWFSGMVLFFARLKRLTRGSEFQLWLKGVTGVVFISFGIKLATVKA